MLERHIQVGQYPPLGHQRYDLVDVGIGVDVVQPDPHIKIGQCAHQVVHARFYRAALPEAGAVLYIHAIGTGVLRNDQQLLDAGLDEVLRLLHHVADRPADKVAAHRGNDAKAAAVVATLGDFQVGVMRGREFDALRRHKVGVGVVRLGQVRVHRLEYPGRIVRPGHRQHRRMRRLHHAVFCPEAAGNDHLAVFRKRLADGVQRFGDRRVDEAAGIDDYEVRALVGRRHQVTLGAQLREDALRVDQRLGATKRHKAHFGRHRLFLRLHRLVIRTCAAGGGIQTSAVLTRGRRRRSAILRICLFCRCLLHPKTCPAENRGTGIPRTWSWSGSPVAPAFSQRHSCFGPCRLTSRCSSPAPGNS